MKFTRHKLTRIGEKPIFCDHQLKLILCEFTKLLPKKRKRPILFRFSLYKLHFVLFASFIKAKYPVYCSNINVVKNNAKRRRNINL